MPWRIVAQAAYIHVENIATTKGEEGLQRLERHMMEPLAPLVFTPILKPKSTWSVKPWSKGARGELVSNG